MQWPQISPNVADCSSIWSDALNYVMGADFNKLEYWINIERINNNNNNGIYWKFTIAAKGWITAKIYNDKNT